MDTKGEREAVGNVNPPGAESFYRCRAGQCSLPAIIRKPFALRRQFNFCTQVELRY